MVGEELSKFIIKQYRKSMTLNIEDIITGTVTIESLGGSIDKVHLGCDVLVDYICSKDVYKYYEMENTQDITPYLVEFSLSGLDFIKAWFVNLHEDVLFRILRSIRTNIEKEHGELFSGLFVYYLIETLNITDLLLGTLDNA